LAGIYKTGDGRWLAFTMLQPGRYWEDFCHHLGREDLVEDERFDTTDKVIKNAPEASEIIAAELASKPFAHWVARFQTLQGPWAPVQNSLEVGHDEQLRINGYVAQIEDVDGVPRELISAPVQFDETPSEVRRAPQFAEHTDEILAEIGRSTEEILELKIAGAVT
jgi:crotonobetainyl-CoA:carnitine CoA-transferase CaiB-like acyl-CoA transferase